MANKYYFEIFLSFVLVFACAANAISAPVTWDTQMTVFNRVFKPHPKCLQGSMSEMECSNFRARALKRFQMEWSANAYWQNGRVIANETADRRVNSEFPR
ncbi:hypothetical protein C664_10612 [Thauera sp. 63]|nr:hypothetical protein C664_10612 [Thauera sp. 63]